MAKECPLNSITVCVAIATRYSGAYIYGFLTNLCKEINLFPDNWDVAIVLCLNGTNDGGKTRGEIERFNVSTPHPAITVLEEPQAGKNRAINMLIEYAKNHNKEIIHFVDDDVVFRRGSIRSNIETLIPYGKSSREKNPVAVGSHWEAVDHGIDYFFRKSGLFRGCYEFILFKILSLDTSSCAPRPHFLSGQSFAAFTNDLPRIPNDGSGYIDDSFISGYYISSSMKTAGDFRRKPIVKPLDSIVYYECACSLSKWWKQQMRNYAGVSLRDNLFEKELKAAFIAHLLWPYSYKKEYRSTLRNCTILQRIGFVFHIALKTILCAQGEYLLCKGTIPPWGSVRPVEQQDIKPVQYVSAEKCVG